MPENPIYNPNNIVRKEPIPVYNPNNIVKKEVVDTRVFSEDPNVKMPEYTTPKDLEIDNAINFIDKQAIESGRIALTEERKGVLKDVLKNPNATKEQKEQAILTMQGYDKDTSGDVSNKFYMQQDSNGVYVPKLLKHGQRPPKGTAINSFHGTQADANDDAWYTDLSKSLANGLVEAAGGVIDLAQAGQQLITGEESEILNDARNSVDFFKFKKDEDLNRSIYNTEGITKWADLLDKDRIDISPSALWGTFNGLAESLSEFGFGTMVGGSIIKGAKGAKYALQGVDKAVELGSAAQKSAIVFGSTIAQLGDVMDAAKEAGLKGRDASAFALTTATAMGAIDAITGLEGKVMSDLFKRSKKQILKNAIKTVERDINGNITPEAFKELAKRTSIQYGEMARNAGKEIVKDAVGEGTQEAIQDFTQKAAENLWDKMTPDERGQFGTDAFDAKSFGSYLNSFATGAFTGIPMALQQQAFRKKNEEQSVHIYDRIKQGEEAIKALKIDLHEALVNNDINQSEYDQAIFKIDSYDKYHQETKNVNLKPEDEKKAFELSFQIQGLKTEIPTNENEISKLDPIARAKVESKQKQAKELQSELNDIIRRGEIKGEPVVPKKEEERIQKEKEKEIKTEETNSKLSQEELVKKTPKVKEQKVKSEYQPIKFEEDKRTYEEVTPEEFNENKFPSRSRHRMLRKELSNKEKYPKGEISGKLIPRTYVYNNEVKNTYEVQMTDGKKIRLSSSMLRPEGFRGHMRTERLKGNAEGLPVAVKVIDLNEVPADYKMPEGYKSNKKILKVYQKSDGKFLGWAKETHKGGAEALDKKGEALYNEQEIDLIKHLETVTEEPASEKEMEGLRQPLPKVPVSQRATEATEQIVKENKEKVKQEKQKQNGKQESSVDGEKSFGGNNEKVSGEDKTNIKETKLKSSKSRVQRKVKEPNRIKASKTEVSTPYDLVMQHFIGGGYIDSDSLKSFFKGKESERFARQNLTLKLDKYNPRYAPNMKDLAHSLWEDNQDKFPQYNTEDYFNALEEVLLENTSPIQMAKDLLKKYNQPQLNRQEELLAGIYEDENVDQDTANNVIDYLEGKTDEELKALAEKDKWEEGTDIVIYSENKLSNIEENTNAVIASSPEGKIKLNLATSIINKQFIEKDLDRKLENIEDKSSNITDLEDLAKKYNIPFKIKNSEIYTAEGRIKMDNLIAKVNEIIENEFQELIDNSVVDFTTVGKTDFIIHKDLINSKSINISFELTKKDIDYVKVVEITAPYSGVIELEFEGETIKINAEFNKLHEIKKITDIFGEKVEKEGLSVKGLSKDIAFNSAVARKYSIKDAGKKSKELEEELNNKLSKIDKLSNEFNEALYQSIGVIPDNSLETLGYKPNTQYTLQEKNNKEGYEPFQKVSQRKGDYSKVVEVISKAFNNKNIKVVVDEDQFKGEQSTVAGKVSADGKFIYINPNYAGLDTPIHEAGHILIDAMGYNNKVIQSAIKQLRNTDLYTETKQRYKELSEQELDKEVLAEAIGREGADIFDKVEDRSKFKAYLDYIFDWLKQKLGLDKNVAKSLAKQIIGGVKTKNLEGVATGKEQLQKEKTKKKNPIGVKPLTFAQYAVEHGFSYEVETNKMEEALVNLQEATDEMESAREDAENAKTDEEAEVAEKILSEKETVYKEARKAYAIAGKRTFEYKKYKKDFNAIQEVLKEKDLSKYTVEELQDLIAKIHGFDDRAAKSVKEEAMLKLAFLVRKEIQAIHSERDNYIESVADSKDITPLQKMLLHISHFTEYQPEMQKLSLEFGKAVMDKISDASTRKGVHEKLAQKVIAEENKKLGITGAALTRFSSDSAKYFEWMANEDGNLLTVEEAQKKGLSEAKINYLKFTRETIADYKEDMSKDNFENVVMEAIKVDKGFQEAFKSEGLLEAFSYYLGGGGYNLGKVRIEHNGTIKSYAEIEKEILAKTDKKSITSILSGLWELLKSNVKARRQLKKGYNVDESVNPLEIKGDAEYSLNNKGQLVSKFDKPRSKDRGYSKDFYRAMNQFIDESAHVKHMSKIMPLVESVEYLNKKGYMEKGIQPKKNVAKWIEDWKALHIFKEPHVNDPVLDASIKLMRKLVASTTMWFNIPANTINVLTGNYNNWRQENGKTIAKGNARLFGGKGERGGYGVVNKYALDIIKKYNIVNQDFDSQPTLRANNIFAKMATIGTQLGEYQIQGSLALGLMPDNVYNSFEYKKDKYGNDVLVVKDGVNEDDVKKEILKVKNRVTDIQGKYPDEDRRNIMRGEFGKAIFQFKVWMPDWFRERFAPEYYNAFGERKEGTLRALYKDGFKKIKDDLKSGNFKELAKNKAFMSNLKGLMVITALLAYKYQDDDDDEVRGKITMADNLLGQVLFIMDPEQDKYMVSNPVAALGKTKDFINAAEAIITLDEKAWDKTKRVLPANKLSMAYDLGKKIIE